MKPNVDMKRCFASKNICKAIKSCPVDAISYIEVADPILDKNLICNCAPPAKEKSSDGCECGGKCGNDVYDCGGTPYGRIVIDYGKCIECGICAEECCGTAIDMIE